MKKWIKKWEAKIDTFEEEKYVASLFYCIINFRFLENASSGILCSHGKLKDLTKLIKISESVWMRIAKLFPSWIKIDCTLVTVCNICEDDKLQKVPFLVFLFMLFLGTRI